MLIRVSPPTIRSVKSWCVFLYFLVLVLHNLFSIALLDYLWYAVLLLCFVLGVARSEIRIRQYMVVYLILFVVFAGLNFVLVKNSSIADIIYPIFYIGVFYFFVDPDIDERYLQWTIYVNCVIMIVRMFMIGLGNSIFGELSTNYVSVLLLLPLLIYYMRAEDHLLTFSLWPAVAVWITCLLAVGRGGILSSSIFLCGILFYFFFIYQKWEKRQNRSIFRLIIIICFIVLVLTVCLFSSIVLNSQVFQRFAKYGMYGTGRSSIWKQYLINMVRSPKGILFGVDFSQLSLMKRFNNNLHNSFLNVHAYYGLPVLLYYVGMMMYNFVKHIKMRNWISTICIVVFFIRAFTDKIFGGGLVATPILYFLIWYHLDTRYYKKSISRGKSNDR